MLALLAVLAFVCFPAMSDNRATNRTLQCLNNLRQLGAGWLMFADDHQGRLVPNRLPANPPPPTWVGGFLDFNQSNPYNTNTTYLIGPSPSYGMLGPYVRSAALFRCPSDPSSVITSSGRRVPRVRSYAMNNFIGEGASTFGLLTHQIYTNLASIGRPQPSQLWLIIEEHPASINDGTFVTTPGSTSFVDFPAAYHNACCNFAFTDGHADSQPWLDRRTLLPLIPSIPFPSPSPGNQDLLWLQSHATQPK